MLARLLPFANAIFSVWQKCGMLAERKKKGTETQQCAEFRCFVLVTRTGIELFILRFYGLFCSSWRYLLFLRFTFYSFKSNQCGTKVWYCSSPCKDL